MNLGLCTLLLLLTTSYQSESKLVLDVTPQASAAQALSGLHAGELHYARIPVQYWEHRLQMAKAMGLNAVGIYVMWNYHQIQQGIFDFQTDNRNLTYFLELCQKHNLSVIFRPGPYVCAQWDLGGLPARLYADPQVKIRSSNSKFLQQCDTYLSKLSQEVARYIRNAKNPQGCIAMIQVQNQYGSYGSQLAYMQKLYKLFVKNFGNATYYHEDGSYYLKNSHIEGLNIGLSGGDKPLDYEIAKKLDPQVFVFGGEIYPGWLTHWGEQWQKVTVTQTVQIFEWLLRNKYSFSIYMVHGGTNFGLTAGANWLQKQTDYTPHVTSYDYDAPINEQGAATAKYMALRELIEQHIQRKIPNPPKPIRTIEIEKFKVNFISPMLDNLKGPAIRGSSILHPFESKQLKMFNQGIVVYETKLQKGSYSFEGVVRDFAQVIFEQEFVTSLDRTVTKTHKFDVNCTEQECNLQLLVEAMGHINYGAGMANDLKGIFNLTVSPATPLKWDIYRMPIDETTLAWPFIPRQAQNKPALFGTIIELSEVGDTYLDMSQFTKGYVFVNMRNLGRYWKKGPQFRLYCPGVWLRRGKNTIHVLELLHDGKQKFIEGKATLNSKE